MSEKANIKELAVAAWRLEKWLGTINTDRKMAAKSALRSIKKYIAASGVEVKDPIGAKFDPGLAIEVVNNEAQDAPEEALIITETISPYIYMDGKLVQHARVIIGNTIKERKDNNNTTSTTDSAIIVSKTNEKHNLIHETDTAEIVPKSVEQDESPAFNADEKIIIGNDEIERMMTYAKIL